MLKAPPSPITNQGPLRLATQRAHARRCLVLGANRGRLGNLIDAGTVTDADLPQLSPGTLVLDLLEPGVYEGDPVAFLQKLSN